MLSAAQENALYTWLNGQTGISASWKNQKAPELAYPFAQLAVIAGPTREGMSDSKTEIYDPDGLSGEEITITAKGPRLYTVTVDVYASSDIGGANAQHYISLAEKALEKSSVRLALLIAGIAIVEVLPPIDLDETVNEQWVSRCKLDLRIRTNSIVTDKVGYIETVNIAGTIGDRSLSIALDLETTFMAHYGELVLDAAVGTIITGPGTYNPIAGTFSVSNLKDFEAGGPNGLKYVGTNARTFLILVAGQGRADNPGTVYLKLAVDDVVNDDSKQQIVYAVAGDNNFSMTALITLEQNEVLTAHVAASTAMVFTANTLVITPIAA